MHRRAREHVGLVIERKIKRYQRRIINSITGGRRNYLRWLMSKGVYPASEEYIRNERTFRPDHPKVISNKE